MADALAQSAPDILLRFPVDRYLGFFAALPPIAPYHSVPAEARAFCDGIEASYGAGAVEDYHRLAMLQLTVQGADDPGVLTEDLHVLRRRYLARIVADMEAPRKGFYRHGNDRFAKDFAVCRGKLLPGGIELIDRCAGIGRRVLLSGGVRQFFSGLRFFRRRMGGFKPFYELHFDRRLVRDFNAEGYTRLYLRVADLLARNPQIGGVVSNSWWHDPRLAAISPELSFIGHHPENAGARILRGSENAAATADALRFAPQRAALHAKGEYRPCVHLLAWARRDVLAWAAAYRALQPEISPALSSAVR